MARVIPACNASIETARAGLETLVLDAHALGFGCSTRNGGQISTSIKPTPQSLARKFGAAVARELLKEGQASLDYVAEFVAENRIDCDHGVVGRFHGAHTPGMYEKLARDCERGVGSAKGEAFVVPRSDQHLELGTDFYHGGVVYPNHASIDPAKFHAGALGIARRCGVKLVGRCPANRIVRAGRRFIVETEKGRVRADKVVIATNGYTGGLTPELRRRVIPVGSYIIATEKIEEPVMRRLFPKNRIISDTRRIVCYYRKSPDQTRVLFGGRVLLTETDPLKSAPMLKQDLTALFPDLESIAITHSWGGFVGYTFDTLMHAGEEDGLFYAMGYCGSGVGMASYLGMRLGRQVAEVESEPSAFTGYHFADGHTIPDGPGFWRLQSLFTGCSTGLASERHCRLLGRSCVAARLLPLSKKEPLPSWEILYFGVHPFPARGSGDLSGFIDQGGISR